MAKSKSMFIQISKPIYHQNQIVRFRVIPVYPNLSPFYGTLVTVEVLDATQNLFRRWLNPMTNLGGILEFDFPLAGQITEGEWTIRVRDDRYAANKTFFVKEYWEPLWDVNVTVPIRANDNMFGIFGIFEANYTTGKAVDGNATVLVTLKGKDPTSNSSDMLVLGQFSQTYPQITGFGDFLIPLSTLQNMASISNAGTNLDGMEVWFNVSVFSWWERSLRSGWAYTTIYSGQPRIKFLGGAVRPFKPGMYFTAYMVVYMPDGTHVGSGLNRKIRLNQYCNDNRGSLSATNVIPVPDDGVTMFTFKPSEVSTCITYGLEAQYIDSTGQERVLNSDQQRIFTYYSKSNTFLQLTTSTPQPMVNGYMVINVQTNYPTDRIQYLVSGGGNVIMSDELVMPNAVQSRTFSVAVSREMAPVSRVVAFFVKQDGEVVADALTFFANYSRLNNVDVKINKGKDLTMDTVEVRGTAEPGSYLGVNVLHHSFYQVGASSFLREVDVVDEMYSYESNAQGPFQFTWYDDMLYVDRAYLPSPVFGADTNTTFNSSGLLLFSDANFTQVNFYHTCNETENPANAFPCFDTSGGRSCYSRKERCDRKGDCSNWIDEMNCDYATDNDPKPIRSIDKFDIIYRLWQDGAWLWHTTFVKPDGHIQFRVDLPKMVAQWMVGAFAIDKERGLSLMPRPRSFSGTRRFFMTIQVPEEARRGEQIGIRASIFNYWDYWVEALVEVKSSPDIANVIVGYGGITNSYSPNVARNQSSQNLVYLEAGTAKYIYMPILPNPTGNSTYTICAYSFIGSNCETRTVRVTMNGVTNHYHSANFLDMTSSSELFINNFKIIVPQMFTVPEQRSHRFVPGSQIATVNTVGDILGPTLDQYFQFANTESVLHMFHGSAENVFFELGYNLQLLRFLRYGGYLTASFLESRQEKSSILKGSWNVDLVLDRRFRPVIDPVKFPSPSIREAHRRLPVAAMVVISLVGDASNLPSGRPTSIAQSIVLEAVTFIKTYIMTVDDIFSKSIGALALSRSGSSSALSEVNSALNFLDAQRKSRDEVYLSNYRIPMVAQELDESARRLINPRFEWPNDGYATASTSIFFLTMLEQKRLNFYSPGAIDIIRWLSTERNHFSGFTSTFFALLDKNRELYRLQVQQTIASNNAWVKNVYLVNDNYTQATDSRILGEDVWGDFTMKADGTGMLLLQLHVDVNVEFKNLEKFPRDPFISGHQTPFKSFNIECKPRLSGRNYSIMHMDICGSWVGNQNSIDNPAQSGMAVFEVDLPTGYIVLNNDLRDYVNTRQISNLKYARFNQRNKVFFFFDSLSNNETCVTFRSERYFPVANMTRELLCTAYEYYERGRYNQSLYKVVSLFTNNICNVCGAFNCPYCPDYNSAVRLALVEAPILFYFARALFVFVFSTFIDWFQFSGLNTRVT
ncbi:hypothetical protein Ciccas_001687 [Cichlidogyrus casuarinus]|uniref:CD109 antigen n=1 Tax=Cichlidogyrus casuarinus TaxID=1844966 RepID=A0ABD2QJC1_9PLAT